MNPHEPLLVAQNVYHYEFDRVESSRGSLRAGRLLGCFFLASPATKNLRWWYR